LTFPRRHITTISIAVIAIVTIWTSSNINWGSNRAQRIIKVDGNGYYAYLPAIFIYHDLHFGFFGEIANREGYENMAYDYRNEYNGSVINKYFAGTALAQMPFFLASHGISWMAGLPMDGYSRLYLIFISLASLFYLILSCIFINKILEFYKISPVNRALTLLVTVFGTNVFYYAVYEPSMSHIYSLGFVTIFIYSVLRYFRSSHPIFLLPSALSLGVIVLIRPVNLLVLASVPFLAGDLKSLKSGLFLSINKWKHLLTSIILFLAPLLIQAILYKIQTGNFWVYSYGEERFHFDEPHMVEILFSYRKGLFVYSPVLFISLAGLYYIGRKSASLAAFWVVFFLLLTYFVSCWHQWFYGGSFGSRVYVEYLGFFAILLGVLFENVTRKTPSVLLISFLGILVVYSIIQTYQYYAGIIHWSDMDRASYWEVFLKLR
jgi:hypothetical protein